MWVLIIIVVIVVFGIMGANYESNKKKERADSMNSKLSIIENFSVTNRIDGFGGFYVFAIDETNEKIALVTTLKTDVVSFADIVSVEVIEDGSTVSKKSTTRTIGGALVGGVLAGGVGTIVGGLSGNSTHKNKVSTVTVKILIRNLDNPSILITCFDSRTMTTEHKASIETEGKLESYIYKLGKQNANSIKDIVSLIIDRVDKNTLSTKIEETTKIPNSISVADELLKLNELREKGILSEDEFKFQKDRILG